MKTIPRREGARPWVSRFFFESVVQSVFGVETCVVTPHMRRVLRGFQDQVEQRLMGGLPQKRSDGGYKYTLAEAAREEARFNLMDTYIQRRQNTVAQYIATQPILDLCRAADKKLGTRVGMCWWEQAVLDLVGARETVAEV